MSLPADSSCEGRVSLHFTQSGLSMPAAAGVLDEKGYEYIVAHTGPRELDGHHLGGCGSGFGLVSCCTTLSVTPVAGPTFETKNRATFSGELFSGEEFLEQHYCPRTLFPSMSVEHLYKNVFTASFPKRSVRNLGCSFVSKKRTRSGSNVSSRLGKDQLSIHFTSLLDYLKSSKHYCPRTDFLGSNSSPEKSSPEKSSRFLSRKLVLRPALPKG